MRFFITAVSYTPQLSSDGRDKAISGGKLKKKKRKYYLKFPLKFVMTEQTIILAHIAYNVSTYTISLLMGSYNAKEDNILKTLSNCFTRPYSSINYPNGHTSFLSS